MAKDDNIVFFNGELRPENQVGIPIRDLVLSQPNCWQDRDGEA